MRSFASSAACSAACSVSVFVSSRWAFVDCKRSQRCCSSNDWAANCSSRCRFRSSRRAVECSCHACVAAACCVRWATCKASALCCHFSLAASSAAATAAVNVATRSWDLSSACLVLLSSLVDVSSFAVDIDSCFFVSRNSASAACRPSVSLPVRSSFERNSEIVSVCA